MIDSHCHLNDERFRDDLPEVLQRAQEAGIRRIMVVGYCHASSSRAMEIVRDPSLQSLVSLSALAGISPHESESWSPAIAQDIREMASSREVVGIGEIGLDYYYPTPSHEVQQRAFREQIEIAMDANLPVVFHLRDASADFYRILDEMGFQGQGILHCFTGDEPTMREGIDRGLHVSYSGITTFKKGGELLNIAVKTPIEHLLVETDAPYLAPEPHRGKRCEPCHVIHTARLIAMKRGISYEALERAVEENLERLFPVAEIRP